MQSAEVSPSAVAALMKLPTNGYIPTGLNPQVIIEG
jgi:hypothetical protein